MFEETPSVSSRCVRRVRLLTSSYNIRCLQPDVPLINRKKTISKGPRSPEAIAMRRIMREADPRHLDGALTLPEEDTGERAGFVFYQDEGGLRATDEANENMDTIYYLGVIDILTPYNGLKKMEHFWKGLSADRVSAARLFAFLCLANLAHLV